MIFVKDIVQDGKLIAYSDYNIKKQDETIVYIEIPKSKRKERKDLQMVKDVKVDESIPTITCHVDYENEDLDQNFKELEQQAKRKDD